MNVERRAFLGLAVALILTLAACDMPRRMPGRQGPTGTAGIGPAPLDPAAPFLNLEKERLRVLWRHDLSQVSRERQILGVYLADGSVVVEAGKGALIGFDAMKGTRQFGSALSRALRQPPVMCEGDLFGFIGIGMVVIDVQTGATKRTYPIGIVPTAVPVTFARSLILGAGDGDIERIGTQTGSRLWRGKVDGPVLHPPVTDERNVYAVGEMGSVGAFEGSEGAPLWSWKPKAPSKLIGALAKKDDALFVADDRGYLHALTAADGAELHKLAIGGPVVAGPMVLEDKLLVVTIGGQVTCLTAQPKPVTLWQLKSIEQVIGLGERALYLLSKDDLVVAVDADTGEEQWSRPLAEGCKVISDPATSVFYVYSVDGAIMALDELEPVSQPGQPAAPEGAGAQ